ncbi:MAG TPA: hypothetical protein PKA37_09205 [Planctomycetota bacterium]|jgi:hypothetical protein|nr:hypothetical protein [Planctomycetota bacterium]
MKPETVLRWTARGWGVASGVLLIAFAFGGREHFHLTTTEAVGFLFFPVGVILGFGLAWWHDLAGGLLTLGSLALFYAWLFVRDGRLSGGPYFLLFAAPGFLHVATAILVAKNRNRGPRSTTHSRSRPESNGGSAPNGEN